MEDTILFPFDRRSGSKLATGYGHTPRRQEPRAVLSNREPRTFAPAGGYYSTVMDMAKFAMWQFRVLDGRDNRGDQYGNSLVPGPCGGSL